MEAIAKGKYLKGSPQKARLVIDLIRGKNVQEALAILRFTKKRATRAIEKVLLSAVANAREKNATADVDRFVVDRAVVDIGADEVAPPRSPGAHGPGLPGAAPVQAHYHLDQGQRRRGIGEVESWVRKFIRTASGLESTGRGARAGSPARTMARSCMEDLNLKLMLKKKFSMPAFPTSKSSGRQTSSLSSSSRPAPASSSARRGARSRS